MRSFGVSGGGGAAGAGGGLGCGSATMPAAYPQAGAGISGIVRRHIGVNFFAGAFDAEAVLEDVDTEDEVVPGAGRMADAEEDEADETLESVGAGAAAAAVRGVC